MLLKWMGLAMLFAVCVAAGLLKSAGLSRRVRQLEGFSGAVDAISSDIRYLAPPVEDLLRRLDALPEYRELRLFGLCADLFAQSRDLPAAWKEALCRAAPALSIDKGDREALLWFGGVLGTTDTEGQEAACARYGALLNQRLEQARTDKARRGRMFATLGVLAGVCCVVLLV